MLDLQLASIDAAALEELRKAFREHGLLIFRDSPFPLDVARLVTWAERIPPVPEMDGDQLMDEVTDAACTALAEVEAPAVRALALRQIDRGVRLDRATGYLVRNPREGDWEILAELAVGLEMMVDGLRAMVAEQERTRAEIETGRQQLENVLEEALAVQRRYLREHWERYPAITGAARGYYRFGGEGPLGAFGCCGSGYGLHRLFRKVHLRVDA